VVLATLASPTPPGAAFGTSVALVGDIDGDGAGDLAVGEPGASASAAPGAGKVHVFAGGTGSVLLTVDGSSSQAGLGYYVGGVGDVDADGVPDFGAVALGGDFFRVFSGSTGNVIHTFLGGGFFCSREVDEFGDVDGDGYGDILLGYPCASSPSGAAYAGQATVHSGLLGSVLLVLSGTSAYQAFGHSIAAAGDLDGDGIQDMLVGAPTFYPYLATSAAFVGIYSGASGAPLLVVSPNPMNGDGLGRSVSGGVDSSGDGVADLVVGAPFDGGNLGAVHLFSGASGATIWSVFGSFQSGMGWDVDLPGDVDGDGVPDVASGAPGLALPGRIFVLSGTGGQVLLTFSNPAGSSTVIGRTVAPASDYNGDGFPDIIAGTSVFVPPGGLVHILSGAPLGVSAFGSGCPGSGGGIPRIGATGIPTAGETFLVHLSRALGGTIAALLVGSSNSSWAGVPLPLNLSFLGSPSCNLHVSPDFVLFFPTAGAGPQGGAATASFAIPALPSFVGATAYAQWYVIDPGPAAIPGSMTRSLGISIQ
jgi:hypothetical protein